MCCQVFKSQLSSKLLCDMLIAFGKTGGLEWLEIEIYKPTEP
jgi:hypothetical protein